MGEGRSRGTVVTVSIAIIVEGATEKAFANTLRGFLAERLPGRMPKLRFIPEDGRIPTEDRLRRDVCRLLTTNDAVIALTDVYTGTRPPEFGTADEAKTRMRRWVGPEPRFYPHAAQYEFEAWLLPYWPTIQKLAGSNLQAPSPHPETVNHDRPPATRLAEVFRTGSKKRAYSKTRDGAAILRDQNLTVAAAVCPGLREFLNTILDVCGGAAL
jgi:hypothetical protein